MLVSSILMADAFIALRFPKNLIVTQPKVVFVMRCLQSWKAIILS
jgi:hypothetical protein